MSTQTIDATVIASSHPDIAKRIHVSGFIGSAAILLVGIAFFVSTFELSDKSSAGSMALLVVGTALVVFGLFRMLWKSKVMVYLPTGSVAKESSYFFDLKHLNKLTDLLEKHQLDVETPIASDASGNVRLDVIVSQDKMFAAVQLFQFIPYSYSPVTSICYFTGAEAAAICAFLLKCKTA